MSLRDMRMRLGAGPQFSLSPVLCAALRHKYHSVTLTRRESWEAVNPRQQSPVRMNAYVRIPPMSAAQARKHAIKNTILAIVTLAVFVLAIIVLQRSLAKLSLAEVLDSLRAEPARRVAACALLTCCSYFMLTLYDLLAVHGVRHPLPWRKVAPVSFIAF